MNVFNVNVRFDNPTEIKALMKAENAQHMKEVLMEIFEEVKNLEIVNIADLGSVEEFDLAKFQRDAQEELDFAQMPVANEKVV